MPERTTRLNDGADLEIAHAEDFGLSRDPETEELRPKKQRIPGTDKAIAVIPLADGAAEEYEDVLEADAPDDERVEELFDEHIVEGIGADADLSKIPDYVVPGLIQAVKNSSGHEVFRAVEDQQMREQMGIVQALTGEGDDSETLHDLIELGREELDGQPETEAA